MAVFHIILRHLALIDLPLFCEEIDREAFLAEKVGFPLALIALGAGHVFFICHRQRRHAFRIPIDVSANKKTLFRVFFVVGGL